MAAEDLAWLLARLQTRDAQQDFLSLLRYALGGIAAASAVQEFPHVAGIEELAIPRWPFLIAYKRERGRVVILRLLPRYGRFADK
jgi:hypothetical protein